MQTTWNISQWGVWWWEAWGFSSQRFGAGTWMLGAKQAQEKAGLALCPTCRPSFLSSRQRAPSPHPLNVNVCVCFHSFCSETLFCFFFPQSLVEISSLHQGFSHRKPWSPFGLTKPPSVPCPRLWLVSTSGASFPSSPPFPLDQPLPLARCRV